MIRYDLSRMVRNPRVKAVALPIVQGSPAFEISYLAAMRRMNAEIKQFTYRYIMPLYKRDLNLMRDIASHEFGAFDALIARLNAIVENTLDGLMAEEAERHTKKFMRSVKRKIGINIAGIIAQEDLEDYLESAMARNVALIQGASSDTQKRVKYAVMSNLTQQSSARELATELKKQFGFADSRARLIARDQTAKINSELNRIRAKQAGLESYIWRTAQDERVRPLHNGLDGNVYKYDEKTGAESGLPPGQPIQCRCIAAAIVSFVSELEALELEEVA